jgi:hypothetical protein
MRPEDHETEIIFILGIMPRSGTHFLANLLCQHPECGKGPVSEDALVENSHLLLRYANETSKLWERVNTSMGTEGKKLLLESLGKGLKSFLSEAVREKRKGLKDTSPLRYLVTKNPFIRNVEKFFRLFPENKLLIIIRDGRSLVQSKSGFSSSRFEDDVREWAGSVRRIRSFKQRMKDDDSRYMIVKYEELHKSTEQEMRKILDFLGLDASAYDFEAARDLPVVGSSEFKGGKETVHWIPVKKTESFDPLSRAAGWTRKQHERFNWLAKEELLYLGYEPVEFTGLRTGWNLWNRLKDANYKGRLWKQRTYQAWKHLRLKNQNHK